MAQELAGHPSSPPQRLSDNTRGPRRTWAETPSATVAVGSVVPAAQLAVPEKPQAILHVWVDASWSVYDPTHTLAIPSLHVPELLNFIASLKSNQGGQGLSTASPTSASAQVTSSSPVNLQSQPVPSSPYPPATIEKLKAQPAPSSPNQRTAYGRPKSNLVPSSEIPNSPNSQPITLFPITARTAAIEKHKSPLRPSSSVPDILPADEIPKILRERNSTLAYTREGRALYGRVAKMTNPDTSSGDSQLPQRRHDDTTINEDSDMDAPHQLDDDTAANEDSSMDDVSEISSSTSPFAESSVQEAAQSVPETAPRTPRGSRWGFGSFIQSARSHFGFSPLTPVSERSEPTLGDNKVASENSAATTAIHQDPEEAQPAQDGQPDTPSRWPSRSLEKSLTTNKRKGWEEPDKEQQPIKLRRIGDVFDSSSMELKNGGVTINGGQQSWVKTPIPITNSAGTFKVPSPTSSDWSDTDDEEVHVIHSAGTFKGPSPTSSGRSDCGEEEDHIIPPVKSIGNPGPTGHQRFTAYQDWCKTASPAVSAALASMEVDPHLAGYAFKECLGNSMASGKGAGSPGTSQSIGPNL